MLKKKTKINDPLLLKSNNINNLYISIKHAPQVLPDKTIENIHEAKAAT